MPSGSDPATTALTELSRGSWIYVVRRSVIRLVDDGCGDKAAALTYYSVLSIFPALIAVVSLVGLVGEGPRTVQTLLDIVGQIGADSAVNTVEGPLTTISEARRAAGFALIFGLVGALWSASAYVGAFGRSVNEIYGVEEGRPFWKLRPYQILITVVVLALTTFVVLGLVMSGPLVAAIGETLQTGSTGMLAWRIIRWPGILTAQVIIVGVLYYATPNVRHSKFRWIGVGAATAILVWLAGSLLFGLYVANFASYNKVYGSLAGVVVFLLWLWITNLALLLGAEVNAETERVRELHAGLPAEEDLQLELRDVTGIEKMTEKRRRDRRKARELRRQSRKS